MEHFSSFPFSVTEFCFSIILPTTKKRVLHPSFLNILPGSLDQKNISFSFSLKKAWGLSGVFNVFKGVQADNFFTCTTPKSPL